MKLQLIFFRLMLVAVVVSFGVAASLWGYHTLQGQRYADQSSDLMKSRSMQAFACAGSSAPNCERYQSINSGIVDLHNSAVDHFIAAKRYGWIAVLLPLAIAALFYALRWVLLGKVRPLWVRP